MTQQFSMPKTAKLMSSLGYSVREGSYLGTMDSRIRRYYLSDDTAATVDGRGEGFTTKRLAMEHFWTALTCGELFAADDPRAARLFRARVKDTRAPAIVS